MSDLSSPLRPGCPHCREALPFDYVWPCAECGWPGPMVDPAGLGKDWQNADFFQSGDRIQWREVWVTALLLVLGVLIVRAFGAGVPGAGGSTGGTALEQAAAAGE